MAQDWKYLTGTSGFQQWWRSGQQLIQVPPGGVPEMSAPVTIIRKYDNGDVVVSEGPTVNLRMDQLSFQGDIDDALLIQGAMFRLIARRIDPKSLPNEQRFPEDRDPVVDDGGSGFADPSITATTISATQDGSSPTSSDSGETGDGVIVQP